MSPRRVGGCAAVVLSILLWAACGQVYRPVVLPCTEGGLPNCPVETPPTPSNFHEVFVISNNTPSYPGGAMQIDVGGDSIIAETAINGPNAPNGGQNPTYGTIFPNFTKVFVASAGSLSGGVDLVSSFTPAVQSLVGTGFGAVTAASLPAATESITTITEAGSTVSVTLSAPLSVPQGYTVVITNVVIPNCNPPACNPNAYDGAFTVTSNSGNVLTYTDSTGLPTLSGATLTGATAAFPPVPDFLATTQNNAMYIANYNTNSVFALNTAQNIVSNTAAVGVHPVAMAEANATVGTKLYVANQGSNSVSSLNAIDLSPNVVTGFTGTSPEWVTARGDGQRVYVITQGDGQLETIDTATDTVIVPPAGNPSVGAGANFIFLDPNLNRLYITNPTTGTLYVFSDTGGPGDTPSLITTISFPAPASLCPTGCSAVAPVSVTALADESRFYVASYQTAAACPDTFVGSVPCVIPQLSVFDAQSFALKTTLKLLTNPPFQSNSAGTQFQYAVPTVTSCLPAATYSPGTTRFDVFTVASTDSSKVYVGMCDAGAIAVVNAADNNVNNTGGTQIPADTLLTNLPAAFSGAGTDLQNPILMFTGQ